jgi:hypothetical protein
MRALAPEVLESRKRMGFKGVEKNRRSPDAISPEGTGQSVARHGSAGEDFTQIESRRDDTMGSSHADSLAPEVCLCRRLRETQLRTEMTSPHVS